MAISALVSTADGATSTPTVTGSSPGPLDHVRWKDFLFGDTHARGTEGIHCYTRSKVVTTR